MEWLERDGFERRPLVLIEDHLYHIAETLDLLAQKAPRVLGLLTAVCLDRPGPDTRRSVSAWLEQHPGLQVAAVEGPLPSARFHALDAGVFEQASVLARAIAPLLRPDGLLLQDVQLETLTFVPRGRWWESIYVASTVRGMFRGRRPTCRFLSNKRGYQATFGSDLIEAGFDPRDVLDKNELARLLVPTIEHFLDSSMPLGLEVSRPGSALVETVVGTAEASREEVEAGLDLVLWLAGEGAELGGRLVKARAKGPRLCFKPGSAEATTWRALVEDLFAAGRGVPVLELGGRVAPELAGRAEITNCAARHVHLLRSRLRDPSAIETVEHAYRLDRALRVGRAG